MTNGQQDADDGGPGPGPAARAWRWLRSWRGMATAAAAIVLVAGIVYLLVIVLPTLDDCASGVDGNDDQCIGVSDSFAFHPSFAEVTGRIAAENVRVEELSTRTDPASPTAVRDRVVTLLYVLPVPLANADLAELQRHELEGAYVAQRNANASPEYGGDRPLVRLVVANIGDGGKYAGSIVERIRTYPAEERLVAVLGFGQSLEPIEEAINLLGRQAADCLPDDPTCGAFPVITSLITADGFAGLSTDQRAPHVVRVVPTNADQARAAVAALAETRGTYRVVVVQDINPDDDYAETLGRQFTDAAGSAGATVLRPEEYDSTVEETIPQRMFGIARQLCDLRPDVVYFAGRAAHLRNLVDTARAPESGCQDADDRIEVWTGDDAVNLPGSLPSNITVTYTALAHPGVWTAENAALFTPRGLGCVDPAPEPAGTVCFAPEFGYPDGAYVELADGGAAIGHDVVLTAVLAVRTSRVPADRVGRSDVITLGFPALHGTNSVAGASGWISICNDGNPERKAVPIVGLLPDSPAAVRPGPVPAAGGEPYRRGSPEQC